MPPIRRKGPKGSLVSTRIPVNAINSVATHADNKRMPYEASVIDNCLISLERGVEKRPGFEVVPQYTFNTNGFTWDFTNNNSSIALFDLPAAPASQDIFFYWYSINEDNIFLIGIDFNATGATDKLFYVYQLMADNSWKKVTPDYQWDPTDIPSTYNSGNSNSVAVNTVATSLGVSYATARAAGMVNKDTRAYITYNPGSKSSKETLRVVALGSSLVVLNNQVYAGFSSDTAGKLFDLSGTVTATDDVEGRRVTYYTAAKVMKVYDKGDDLLTGTDDDVLLGWKPGILTGTVKTATTTSSTTIVIKLAGTAAPAVSLFSGSTVTISGTTYAISSGTITAGTTETTVTLTKTTGTFPVIAVDTAATITLTSAAYIPAGDYFYYNPQQAYLGQRVSDLSGIRLPPENDDWVSNNTISGDTKASQMLKSLYDSDTPYPSTIDGRGKVYFTISPYLNATSGYYRVISFPENSSYAITSGTGNGTTVTGAGRPYLQKIRTPDEHSYIDPRRMPQKLQITVSNAGTTSWSFDKIKWTPRTSGDKKTNPGPSIFKTSDGALQQVQIKSMAVFKNRLWFSANDVVFSTRTGQFENLFLNDPANIVSSDPIDVRASSSQYAEISSMVPFEDFLFIDTKAKTQFNLTSSSTMELSPTNVAIAPSTFYSTAPITFPQLVGTRLYFFGPQRMYMYVGKSSVGYSTAVEVSSSAAGYLPVNYRSICTAPAQDSIVMVSEENPNQIYFNTERFSGDRIIQNSFYRYVLSSGINIQSVQVFKNYLYAVAIINNARYVILRSYLMNEDSSVPRFDKYIKIKLKTGNGGNVTYNSTTKETTFTLPKVGYDTNLSRVVLASGWTSGSEDISGTVLADANYGGLVALAGPGYETFTVKGDYYTNANNKYIYFGELFTSRVTLSTLFVRDENNNIINGVLSIRTGVFRHFNTGNYDIEVTNRGRTPLVSSFTALRPDFTTGEGLLPLQTLQNQGEFVAKIYGYSDSTKISIVSDYTTPMNITNMEFKGKFKQKYTTLN